MYMLHLPGPASLGPAWWWVDEGIFQTMGGGVSVTFYTGLRKIKCYHRTQLN